MVRLIVAETQPVKGIEQTFVKYRDDVNRLTVEEVKKHKDVVLLTKANIADILADIKAHPEDYKGKTFIVPDNNFIMRDMRFKFHTLVITIIRVWRHCEWDVIIVGPQYNTINEWYRKFITEEVVDGVYLRRDC